MKRIVFLIIASLLVLGLVLPGCGGGPAEEEEEEEDEEEIVGDIVFEDGKINIGIAGELEHYIGQCQLIGATMATSEINALPDKVNIDGVPHEITLVEIETGEATVDPTGSQGYSALLAKIDLVDFILGGFRTEAVQVYREVAVGSEGKGVTFIDCGAATETLQRSVAYDYTNYKYWFKGTPVNEYFLGQGVVRLVDSVARTARAAGNMSEEGRLRAGIIAEDLWWARDEVRAIMELLPGINVGLVCDPVFIDPLLTDPTQMEAAMAPIAANNPHFVIPVLSSIAGIAYAMVRKAMMPSAMSVGINVYADLKAPWGADNLATPPPGGPACAYDVVLDPWADELEQTGKTANFLDAFVTYSGGEYPLYAAATYDAAYQLKEAIEAVAWYDAANGTAYARTDDIIQWLEDPANAQVTTAGLTAYYPRPGTTAAGKPALTEAQVRSLYDIDSYNYTYDAEDWTMPAHTTHDLVYGPGYLTGVGAQWQWDSGAGQWKKVGVWPMDFGDEYDAALTDQYGCWNFEYPGTVDVVIPIEGFLAP